MDKRFDADKLKKYGFKEKDGGYDYSVAILDGQMTLFARVKDDVLNVKIFDNLTEEEYILHLTGAVGGFVGAVRSAFQAFVDDVTEKCAELHPYGNDQPAVILSYAKERYGDDPEFLWEDDDSAILRRKDNRKWYAIFMNVKRDRFGLEGEKTVPVLNVRIDPDDKERLVDMQAIFPAYHMNKKHWISIFLDGRTDSEIIKKLLDDSYSLALKKPKKQ